MKKIIRTSILFFMMYLLFIPSNTAQDENGGDVEKYTIKEYLETNLPPHEGRKIVLDEISGLLTITDTPKNQELALKLIKEWDVGPKQVEIEAKFIEITFTDLDEMGVNWDLFRDEHPIMDLATGMMGNSSATTAAAFTEAAEMAGLGFFAGKATMTGAQLLAYLKALEQKGKVNLLNAPRVTTISGQMANIQVIRTFPYASAAKRTQVEIETITLGVTTKDIYPIETYEIEEEITGITLEVTPIVSENSDIITMDIHPEVTKLSQQIDITDSDEFPDNLGWPVIDTRTAQTVVMVRSGQTIIIGGLIQDQDQDTIERKIPLLGDVPIIGSLFKYKYEKREKKNLVVFLTARLIDTEGKRVR